MFMIGRLNIAQMAIILKLIYRFNVVPVKIPAGFLAEVNKLISNYKDPESPKQSWKRITKLEDLYFPISKLL